MTDAPSPHPYEFAGPIISVVRASKCYRVYASPKDRLKELLSFGRRHYYRELRALHDVSLDVAQGECVGIVGRNGSGKSTLLQIITQTLRPSTGTVAVQGRVAALLELGSGFNPEFSGRENVYLNATILGLGQSQIEACFDDIVSFADIGDCLDRPIKTYSSGMVLRLAFAVQVQVEPDILIIDEALAVGDEAFQRKCIARLRAFLGQGGTVLFVSHDAHAVIELCDRAVLLDRGEMVLSGEPKHVLEGYHRLLYAPPAMQDSIREQVRWRERIGEDPEDPEDGEMGRWGDEETDEARLSPSPHPSGSAPVAAEVVVDCTHAAGNDRAYLNPDMKPQTTVVYDSLGAEIIEPHVTTLAGEKVNTLLPSQEYVCCYRVRFTREAHQVRFSNAIKSKLDALVSSMSLPYGGIPFVEAGSEFAVAFRFQSLMTPDVYFLNVGVAGTVDGREVYLHRIVDALMIRVSDHAGRTVIGTVNLYTDARYSQQSAPTNGCKSERAAA
jgi:lipopolysaccharide transport system ATP-binding protein